jgi:acetylornithine aminotransferase
MNALFENYGERVLKFVKGEGAYLTDDQGKKYLDLTAGIGVCQLGHAPHQVKAAVNKQLDQLWHTSNLYLIEPQLQLAEKITELSGMDLAFFGNSGAEANEAAIKLARRYQQKVLDNGRYEIITFEKSFHGRTLATLTATGQDKVKDGFAPLPSGFKTIAAGDIDLLKATINDKTAAIMLEMIQGEGGVIPMNAEWVQAVAKLAQEQGIMLIVDEVQTGMCRTGKWFAFQHYGIEPDVITLAKGLASGFPIGAMLAKDKYGAAFTAGSHGSTFGGNFIVTTAALATIEALEQGDILENVRKLESYIFERLRSELAGIREFQAVSGKGLMVGITFAKPVADLQKICREKQLLVLVAGPNVIRLLPPLNINKEKLAAGLDILIEGVKQWQES